MSDFTGANIIVLDLETLCSADDVPTGWRDPLALGLSIGAYYDYRDGRVYWFDRISLYDIVRYMVERQPLMVSFNGIGFDFSLMGRLLLHEAATIRTRCCRNMPSSEAYLIEEHCDSFAKLADASYDILAEIWHSDPDGKFERGLNSLDAILEANSLGQKTGHGAEAPKDWQEGRIAKVLNYCANDVYVTKALFELICHQEGMIQRRNGPLQIRYVARDNDTVTIMEKKGE